MPQFNATQNVFKASNIQGEVFQTLYCGFQYRKYILIDAQVLI